MFGRTLLAQNIVIEALGGILVLRNTLHFVKQEDNQGHRFVDICYIENYIFDLLDVTRFARYDEVFVIT